MPVTHIPIDGLWRCLCPSFDNIILLQSARRTARLTKSSNARPKKHIQARSFTSTNTRHNDDDTSHHRSFTLSKGPAGRNLNVLKFIPQENPSQSSRESPKLLFPDLAERRSTAQEGGRDRKPVQGLSGIDVPDGAGRAKVGYDLGDWGNVPKIIGNVSLSGGVIPGAVPSPKLDTNRAKKQKGREYEALRQSEQKLVDLGPAKWGSMSFGKQTAPILSLTHEGTSQITGIESAELGNGGTPRGTYARTGHRESESRSLNETTARVAAAFEKYQQKTARQSINRSGDAFRAATMAERLKTWEDEDIPMLHDRLRAYRLEAGQFDHVVALVEYLLVKRDDQLALLHYDSLVRANADAEKGSAESVRVLLEEMDEASIKGDSGFYHAVLQTLAVHPDYALRAEIMQGMKERWFGLSPEGWHSLVIGLLRDRQLEMALDRLEEMHTDQILVQPWLYDIITYVLCEHGEHDEAFNIMMYRYEHARFGISLSHWQYILDTFSHASHYAATKHIWDTRVQAAGELTPSDRTCTAVLNIAARNSDPALATSVIKVLSTRHTPLTVHHYEALLESYVGSLDVKTAFRVLSIMETAGLATTAASTRPLFTYLSSSCEACLEAWDALLTLREEGHVIPISAVNVILESLNAQDRTEDAYTHYQKLHELTPSPPNLETINTMLQGLQRTPSSPSSASPSSTTTTPKQKAMSLAQTLLSHKIAPNALTYDRLIRICLLSSTREDLADALLYLKEMEEVGKHARGEKWWMRSGTAMRMVEVCVQKGEAERARSVLHECERRGVKVSAGMSEKVQRMEGEERNHRE